jgi:hypothetical protein
MTTYDVLMICGMFGIVFYLLNSIAKVVDKHTEQIKKLIDKSE